MKSNELHLVIHASAGSGKTYQLVGRYVSLLLAGVDPATILATTFTKKAAGEILQRVLSRLAAAALDEKSRAELAMQTGHTTLTAEAVVDALGRLAHGLHRAQIGTLDAFFRRVVASFAMELGLPPTWRMLDEVDEASLRSMALARALDERAHLLALVRALEQGQTTRAVHSRLDATVTELHDIYIESDPLAWRTPRQHAGLAPDELENALDRLQAAAPTGRPALANAWRKDLARAHRRQWNDFLSRGVSHAVAIGQDQYRNTRLPAELVASYRPLIEHARATLLHRLADRTEATWELLDDYDGALQSMKLRRATLAFGDLARVLDTARTLEAEAELFYRMDGRVAHLLLDEFQDTSRAQWRVLAPLVAETTATADGSRSFFCVGDVKQAIYGWRGAEPRLFAGLDQEIPSLTQRPLHQSWRSSPAVLDVVNRVFGTLVDNPTLQNHADAARVWSTHFTPHETAHEGRPGRVTLRTASRGCDRVEQSLRCLENATTLIREATQGPAGSVGVLLRTRDAVARMRYELGRRGIEASEEGGTPLSDTPSVELILSTMTLADHPGDGPAYYHLRHSPLWHEVTGDAMPSASELSAALRLKLAHDGYGRTVSAWTRALAPSCDARNLDRLRQLVEMAHTFDSAGALRADEFVHRVRLQRMEAPTAASVRVMTIHQAKGLEFDTVVLPQLSIALARVDPTALVQRDDPAAPPSLVVCGLSRALREASPRLDQMYQAQRQRAVQESLSLLYVAMTRAARTLHLVADPSSENEKQFPATMAGLLRAAMTDGEHRLAAPETLLYETPASPSRAAQAEG